MQSNSRHMFRLTKRLILDVSFQILASIARLMSRVSPVGISYSGTHIGPRLTRSTHHPTSECWMGRVVVGWVSAVCDLLAAGSRNAARRASMSALIVLRLGSRSMAISGCPEVGSSSPEAELSHAACAVRRGGMVERYWTMIGSNEDVRTHSL